MLVGWDGDLGEDSYVEEKGLAQEQSYSAVWDNEGKHEVGFK